MAAYWRNTEKGKELYLSLFQKGTTFVLFDTETTGIGSQAKIIEFAAIRYEVCDDFEIKEIDQLHRYINPGEKLSPKIVSLTGITDEKLEHCPLEEQVYREIFDYMHQVPIWIAHNISFDKRMLLQLAERMKVSLELPELVDTLEMARDLFSKEEVGNHKLGTLIGYLFPDKTFEFHSAIEDVKATSLCLQEFLYRYSKVENKEERLAAKLEYVSYWMNPKKNSQVRIKVKLDVGEYGAVFWDVAQKCWSCKSDKLSQNFFQILDLSDLEAQFLGKYKGFGNNMNEITSEMGKIYRKRKKTA